MSARQETGTATVGEYLVQWLGQMRGRVRPKTHQGYESLIRLHALPALGGCGLADLTPLDLQRLYGALLEPERKLAAGTVLNLHLVLTQALGQGERWGIVARSTAQARSRLAHDAPVRGVVDRALAARLLEACRGQDRSLACEAARRLRGGLSREARKNAHGLSRIFGTLRGQIATPREVHLSWLVRLRGLPHGTRGRNLAPQL